MRRNLAINKATYHTYTVITFMYYFCLGIFGSILTIYLQSIGKTSLEISFIISSNFIFSLLVTPFINILYDRINKKIIIISLITTSSSIFVVIFAFSEHALVLFITSGLALSIVQSLGPIIDKLITTSSYTYGSIRVWGAVGFACSIQLSAFVVESFNSKFIFLNFIIALSLLFLSLQKILNTVPIDLDQTSHSQKHRKSILLDKNLILFFILAFLFNGITGVNSTYLPILYQDIGVPISQIGTILFLGTLMEIPLILFSKHFMDKFSSKFLLVSSFLLLIIQFSFYSFTSNQLLIFMITILTKSLATMLFIMITLKVIINIVPDNLVVTILALTNTIKSLGSFVNQNISGLVLENIEIRQFYLLLTIASFISLILAFNMRLGNKINSFS